MPCGKGPRAPSSMHPAPERARSRRGRTQRRPQPAPPRATQALTAPRRLPGLGDTAGCSPIAATIGVAAAARPGQNRAGGREWEGRDGQRKLRSRKGHPGAPQRLNWPRGGDPTTRPEPACWAGPRAWTRPRPGPQLDPCGGRPGAPRKGLLDYSLPIPHTDSNTSKSQSFFFGERGQVTGH